jgi:hypothetical protein
MRRPAYQPTGRGRGVRNLVRATGIAAALLGSPAAAAQPIPEVDQSFTGPSDGGALINECCNYVAQTFTAGRSGLLAGVNISTGYTNGPVTPLRVSIRNVEGSVPGISVLATTVLPTADAPLSQLITFPQHVELRSGVKYAIVVNLETPSPLARAGWTMGRNLYPRGEECAKFNPGIENGDWFCYSAEFGYPDFAWFDLFFRTYVTPLVPTTKNQCKNGGWQTFAIFKNQGDCVSFVATGGRNRPTGSP